MKKEKNIYELQGGATLYVLLLSVLISSLLGAYILIYSYAHTILDRYEGKERAIHNLQGAALAFLEEGNPDVPFVAMQMGESELDSAYLQSERWGAYGILHAEGKHASSHVSRSCLIGQHPTDFQESALFLADRRQPLVLVGKTKIEGKIYIPPAGIKSGFIGKRGFEGRSLFEGARESSKGMKFSQPLDHWIEVKEVLDSLAADTLLPESLEMESWVKTQGWQEPAQIYRSQSDLRLRNCELKGKCIIISSGTMEVDASNVLEHPLLFARHIRIKRGFEGSIQAFALESLEVESEVVLPYPSLLVLARRDSIPAHMYIQKNVQLEGSVIFDLGMGGAEPSRQDYVRIMENGQIWGSVYVQHNLDLRAKVYGHVSTDNFLLKSPGSTYRNHLMDTEIIYAKRDKSYLEPLLKPGEALGIIQWL